MSKIISISDEFIFDDSSRIYSYHDTDCCESHYLDFNSVDMSEVEGLEFDLSNDDFIEKVDGYGIRLIPTNGLPVSVPGYAHNNGYYSSELTLNIKTNGTIREVDITQCQLWVD